MEVLKSIDSALSPLSSLTDILSGETYVTVSAIIPMLQLIRTNLLKEDDTQLTTDIKERVITDLESRYSDHGNVMEILQLATFLDARFKSKPFNNAETDYLKMVITDKCDDGTPTTATTQSANSSNPAVEPPATKSKTLGTFFKEHDGDNVQQSLPSSESLPLAELCKKELENYLHSPKLDFEEDPLAWWRSNSLKYPHLSPVARKYLCVRHKLTF